MIAVGDKLPRVELFTASSPTIKVILADEIKHRNVIVLGLPAAFSPTCDVQVPSFVHMQNELEEVGIEIVFIFCVNDPEVMRAWAEYKEIAGSMVIFLSDANGEFTDALGMKITHPGPPTVGLIGRCKRFGMYVENGIVKYIAVSETSVDPAGELNPSNTLAPAFIKAVENL